MRKALQTILVAAGVLLATLVLTVAAAFTAALSHGAVALIVPGTGTPDPTLPEKAGYLEQARDRYLTGTACGPTGQGCPDGNLVGIKYPASFWPLVIFPNWCRSGPNGCDKWDESVGKGTEALVGQLSNYVEHTDQDIVVFGYSQGGAVVSDALAEYINGLPDEDQRRIEVVTIGGIQTPDGGLWSRLAFLGHIPILDVTLTPAMQPDPDVHYTSYAFHFDPVADAPRYWGNPFAMLNAIAALQTVHGYYLTPYGPPGSETSRETLPYGYDDDSLAPQLVCTGNPNCRTDDRGNEYIVIPARSLPIADLIYSSAPAPLRPLIKPMLELVAPAYRVLAELGYDYTGNPGVSTPLSPLPFNPFTLNPVALAANLAGAVVTGVGNALGGGTSLSPLNPPETAPSTTRTSPATPVASPAAGARAAAEPKVAADKAATEPKAAEKVAEKHAADPLPAPQPGEKTSDNGTHAEVVDLKRERDKVAAGEGPQGATPADVAASKAPAGAATPTEDHATGAAATDTTATRQQPAEDRPAA
ncbi:PE-PPE domain-containing protein [Mycobacterium sp. MYCO198283]|uniref:PE-PPE domain-containing protein n=1 Tax=Mycobacterium sp. MYCO198283 TaxID=2883505 RepID=UPI001E32D605|nr:PE-PPE domain-containing protein [Mycobacterium sp. MYCO198283]MCG5431920.1 PE-PPE domain-containing protein [Mycobacterium sp. MYCO198283]